MEKTSNTLTISGVIIALVYTLVILGIVIAVGLIVLSYIKQRKAANRFKRAVISNLNNNYDIEASEEADKIELLYRDYCSGFIANGHIASLEQLLSELLTDIGNNDCKKYYSTHIDTRRINAKLNSIARYIKEKNVFDYEKDIEAIKNSIFDLEKDNSNKQLCELWNNIFRKLTICSSFYNGRIYQMEIEIEKIKRGLEWKKVYKIGSAIGWIIGVVSGILTILGHFKF